MRRAFVPVLALCLAFHAPTVVADEAAPDCEPGQVSPTWRSTGGAESALGVRACEGEHWDGEPDAGGENLAFGVPLVASGAVFVDADEDGATVAVYAKDDTPGNLAYTSVGALGLTAGHAAEGDCTHAQYEEARHSAIPEADLRCGRDNTAITAQLAR